MSFLESVELFPPVSSSIVSVPLQPWKASLGHRSRTVTTPLADTGAGAGAIAATGGSITVPPPVGGGGMGGIVTGGGSGGAMLESTTSQSAAAAIIQRPVTASAPGPQALDTATPPPARLTS